MNRAEKSSEPSMEDILASIRRIISDEDQAVEDHAMASAPETKKQSEPAQAYRAKPAPADASAHAPDTLLPQSLPSLCEDDVLDLTEELIFADQESLQTSHPASSSGAELRGEPDRHAPLPAQSPSQLQSDSMKQAFSQATNGAPPVPPQAKPNRAQWSRRELPQSQEPLQSFSAGGGSFSRARNLRAEADPLPDRKASDPASALEASEKPWIEDVQMPVSEQGPVPLVGAPAGPRSWSQRTFQAPAQRTVPARTPAGSTQSPEKKLKPDVGDNRAHFGVPPFPLPEKTEQPSIFKNDRTEAVAALARSLAKSAVDELGDEELADAAYVDFKRLNETDKAEVSESFANVIEAARKIDFSNSNDKGNDQSILHEALRHEFTNAKNLDRAPVKEAQWSDDTPPDEHEAIQPALVLPHTIPAHHKREQTKARPIPYVSSSDIPESDASIARAQVGTRPKAAQSALANRSLEESVRDMLRPLLVQWLNDNMPRIIENAIRDEITERGLTPPRNTSKG